MSETWYVKVDDTLYNAPLGGQSGDRPATDAEIAAWQSSQVILPVVLLECQRRIDLIVTDNQKLNMLGSMVANQIAGNHADDANFLASMQWIAAMRSACAGLVGKTNYADDANWPPLSDALKAFGAMF